MKHPKQSLELIILIVMIIVMGFIVGFSFYNIIVDSGKSSALPYDITMIVLGSFGIILSIMGIWKIK